MDKPPDSFAKIPLELLLKIVSHFIPYDVRTLRYIIVACKDATHHRLRAAAENVLQDQKAWLLDRWNQFPTKTPTPEASRDLTAIAEAFIGKQYVWRETIHQADNWAFTKPDLGISNLRICKHRNSQPASCTEIPNEQRYLFDEDNRPTTHGRQWDPSRLNVEVAFISEPARDEKPHIVSLARFTGHNGICTGVFLG